jgi:hypothetical protein
VNRIARAAAVLAAVAAVVALPDAAHACAMCFSGPEESRKAFAVTAAFLTLLPLGMVAGATTWLRSRAKRAELEENGSGPADCAETSES